MITRRQVLRSMLGTGAAVVVASTAKAFLGRNDEPEPEAAGQPGGPMTRPNLLFLWTDEQRADTLATNGTWGYRLPALNALAARSASFSRCHVSQPLCTPSRCTLMTGLWPHSTGCTQLDTSLPPDVRTLPELLADPAYRTGYMGRWHLGEEFTPQHGFETWVSTDDECPHADPTAHSDYHRFLTALGYEPGPSGKFNDRHCPVEHARPMFLANHAARFMTEHCDEPWILYVSFTQPHMPFTGPYDDLHTEAEAPLPGNWPGKPIEREPEAYRATRAALAKKGISNMPLETRADWQRIARNYAGLCTQVDEAVARILSALEASGQVENTIIVFTSDHGEMLGSHSLIGKRVLYGEAIRVPLLIRVPFWQGGPLRIDRPVSHVDLVPTLLDLMGKGPVEGLPGRSLAPLVDGAQMPEDHIFVESTGPHSRAVISPDGWKLILVHHDHGLLFELNGDPLEERNLFYREEYAPIVSRLRGRLEAWQAQIGDRAVKTI